MAARWSSLIMCFVVVAAAAIMMPISAQLSSNFYDDLCPDALPAIRSVVEKAIKREPRMGASLLRLHFHDCFVNGCDGSVLLDDTPDFIGEKTAVGNNNSIRGFDVVDEIKEAVNTTCCGNVVSCADILAVAARDSVEILGGPSYEVLLGRRDARTASLVDANNSIPARFFNFSTLVSNFEGHGLDVHDLVVLSGSHTIGKSRCVQFRDRIYNDTNIKPKLAASLRKICPREGGDDNLSDLDDTPETFDTKYFKQLRKQRGLLHTDQELFKNNGTESDRLVKYYSKHPKAFAEDFGVAMIKMGNIKPLTGSAGEIRMNCRKIN